MKALILTAAITYAIRRDDRFDFLTHPAFTNFIRNLF